jgi:hypothetical protein
VRVPFVLPPGITSDDTSFLSEGRWEDGNNVRPWRGQMQTIGGWVAALDTALTGTCRNMLPWTDNRQRPQHRFRDEFQAPGRRGGRALRHHPAGWPAGAVDSAPPRASDRRLWLGGLWGAGDEAALPGHGRSSTYGESLIANPRGGSIYWWSNNTASSRPRSSPMRRRAVTCALVTPERQIIAFGCNEEFRRRLQQSVHPRMRHRGHRPTGRRLEQQRLRAYPRGRRADHQGAAVRHPMSRSGPTTAYPGPVPRQPRAGLPFRPGRRELRADRAQRGHHSSTRPPIGSGRDYPVSGMALGPSRKSSPARSATTSRTMSSPTRSTRSSRGDDQPIWRGVVALSRCEGRQRE